MIEFEVILLVSILITIKAGVINDSATIPSRRILRGREVGDTRPYMVYLRPAKPEEEALSNKHWLCGGVIIHERYVLTSAACIENVKQFYVVSGTKDWTLHDQNSECIKNGAKRAVSKCVPKSYIYDGMDFDNIRWMSDDIAVVKVESDFNFQRRVKGCDFIPQKIAFNNQSADLERAGQVGTTAGWGTMDSYGNLLKRATVNSPLLLETDVTLISKKNCKKLWDKRYHKIIDESMICTKDRLDIDAMSSICVEQEVNCKDIVYSDDEGDEDGRRMFFDPSQSHVHSSFHNEMRRAKVSSGGFCENDHGGPLVVGQGATAVVIGVISACQTRTVSGKCYGPFLYTSIWKNRHLLSCAINKEMGETCRRLLQSMKTEMTVTSFDWKVRPSGPLRSAASSQKKTIPNSIKAWMSTQEPQLSKEQTA